MTYIISILLSLILFQGGHRIMVQDVTSEEPFGEPGKMTYHVLGSFVVKPFDVKGSDAYVLVVTNIDGKITLHNYEKFNLQDPNTVNYKFSHSFTIDKPDTDFSVYALLVDKFSDKHEEEILSKTATMGSVEELFGMLRQMDRVDPLNFNLLYVQI